MTNIYFLHKLVNKNTVLSIPENCKTKVTSETTQLNPGLPGPHKEVFRRETC